MPPDQTIAPCTRCGKPTAHRRDPGGALHCVRCVIEDSIPPSYDVPDPDAPEPAPESTDRFLRRRPVSLAERILVGVAVLAVAVTVAAVAVGRC